MPVRLVAFALLCAACNTTPAPPPAGPSTIATPAPAPVPATPEPAAPAAEPAAELIPANGFSVHEWGLVDIALGGGLRLSAVPHERSGGPDWMLETDKPILYVHLGSGLAEQRMDISVRIAGGRVLEHWPTTQLVGDTLRWSPVIARRPPCSGATLPADHESLPEQNRSRCNSLDGYCESAELNRYVTPDAACLTLRSVTTPLLFYRGDVPRIELPLRPERLRGGELRVPGSDAFGDTPRTLFRLTRVGGVVRAQPGTLPRAGETTVIAPPTERVNVGSLRAALEQDLRAQGLTPSEANAFLAAWLAEFTGQPTPGSTDEDMRARPEEVLLYWMPLANVNQLAELSIAPPPAFVRRAFLVRVQLL